ncbi:MAG: Smr/MutS family protein [Thauera sp.]|nr:Smr/MutS family protein [Thauera sp.]
MPRRSRTIAAREDQARAAGGKQAPINAFAALAALRKEGLQAPATQRSSGRNAPGAARDASPPARNDAAASADIDAEDVALFLKASGSVQPLRDDGRATLERPRPAPVPRPREASRAGHAEPARQGAIDPLRTAYENVTPLRDTGRVELETRARFRARRQEIEAIPGLLPAGRGYPSNVDPDDAEAVFRHAMQGALPLENPNRVVLERASPAPAPLKREADERAALDESLSAPLSFEDRLDMGDEAAFLRTGLPRRVLSDLRRGRWVLQAQIDLHGFTRDEARKALGHFLVASLQQGHRCIRVIHGKGLGSPGRVSILKQLSRGWLAQREEILAFCQAGPHDGGSGALLVLMRAQNASRE